MVRQKERAAKMVRRTTTKEKEKRATERDCDRGRKWIGQTVQMVQGEGLSFCAIVDRSGVYRLR